jgi:exopolysaccharide production protein ExoZ
MSFRFQCCSRPQATFRGKRRCLGSSIPFEEESLDAVTPRVGSSGYPRGISSATPVLSIQYFRASAAVFVVAYHQFQSVSPIFGWGQYGVDLFFVISGFIMMALTERGEIGAGRFLQERCLRIVPTYWMATLLTAIMASTKIFNSYAAPPDIVLLMKSFAFVPAYNKAGLLWPTLYLGWTLNFEVFFYLVFAATLFLQPRLWLPTLAFVLLSLVAFGFYDGAKGAALSVYTDPRLAEFLGGAFLGAIFGATLQKRSFARTIYLTALAIAFLAVLGTFSRNLIFGAVSMALIASGLVLERINWLPRFPALLAIGNASYSIYLFQQIAFDLTHTLLNTAVNLLGHQSIQGTTIKIFSFAAAIFLGMTAHRLVERPVTDFSRRLILLQAHDGNRRLKSDTNSPIFKPSEISESLSAIT